MRYIVKSKEIRDEVLRQVSQIRKEPLMQVIIEPYEDLRSAEQNDKFQAMCGDISKSVEWVGQKLSKDDWRHIFVAAVKKQRVVPGINGELVVLGSSSRKLSTEEASDMIEMMYAFGAEHGVEWTETIMEEARKTFKNARVENG